VAWEKLSVPQKELVEEAGEREVWRSLLKLVSKLLQKMDGCIPM